jgi:hypothetical protein
VTLDAAYRGLQRVPVYASLHGERQFLWRVRPTFAQFVKAALDNRPPQIAVLRSLFDKSADVSVGVGEMPGADQPILGARQRLDRGYGPPGSCRFHAIRIISREPASDSDQNIALSTHIGAAATNLERSGRLYETELSGARLSLGLEGIDL